MRFAIPFRPGVLSGVSAERRDDSHRARGKAFVTWWWNEIVIKELKGGLQLGRMQVSQDAERVERSVILLVCVYLLFVHLYGRDQAASPDWSLFQLEQRFTEGLM